LDEDLVRSTLTRAAAKGRLSFPENTPIVGTAGRLDRIKRLDIFLRAACEIASALPHARFVIAGEGREENSLRKLADDLGLHDKVQLLGYREDIHDVLRAMDVFVLCSDHEGLPMVLLEALMLGTPVVARQVGGVPEVVQNGVNGILVESADPKDLAAVCLRVLSDEAGRGRMAAAGPASVRQKFTAERTADEVEKLYRTLVAGATVPGGSP
jgi:glycosyltransferase involved in cell wall biosynthesis